MLVSLCLDLRETNIRGPDTVAYQHITAEQRAQIDILLSQGKSRAQIARILGRARSTISREIGRNCGPDLSYGFPHADRLARHRRQFRRVGVLETNEPLRQRVWQDLQKGWSPEQVAGRMTIDGSQQRVSCRTIYRYLRRVETADKSRLKTLPRPPRKRRKTTRQPIRWGLPFGKKHVRERPPNAQLRSEPGHWEGDTLISKTGRPAVVVYVDRYSRFTLARKIDATGTAPLISSSRKALAGIKKQKRHSITLDNGVEFSNHRGLKRAVRMDIYFCDPKSPWQRPTVENTNGLIRHYLTKRMNLHLVSQKHLNRVIRSLNERPRKCLNWRTPAEVFG